MGRTEEYGAVSRVQKFMFDPDKLILITDPKHKLYQATAVQKPPQWMIDSILLHGVKAAIKVRKGPMRRNVQLMEVIYGRRRVLATRAANVIRKSRGEEPYLIPGDVFLGTDEEALTLIQIENHHRERPSMLDDAIAARNALELGTPKAQVLEQMRWTAGELAQHLALLDCDKSVQDAIAARLIPDKTVKALAKLERSEQVEAVKELVAKGATGAKAARAELAKSHPDSAGSVAKQPRGRTRKQIEAKRDKLEEMLATAPAKNKLALESYITSLRWVLGEECL
jgi:hypothetical protein